MQAFIGNWDDWDDHPDGKLISSQGPLPLGRKSYQWMEVGYPYWDEALDESTGIAEAVYFAAYLYRGRSPPL